MLTQGFYYFLVIAELAILGMIIAGIYLKIKNIIALCAERTDDQKIEHYVSESDHTAHGDDMDSIYTTGLSSQAGEISSGKSPWAHN